MTTNPLKAAYDLLAAGPHLNDDGINMVPSSEWKQAALAMLPHCQGAEDVTEAAMRIFAECIRELEANSGAKTADLDHLVRHWEVRRKQLTSEYAQYKGCKQWESIIAGQLLEIENMKQALALNNRGEPQNPA